MAEIDDAADRFRDEILRRERAAAGELVRAYGAAWRRIKKSLDELEQQIAQARARGEEVSPDWLLRFERLQAVQRQVEAEISQFAKFAESKIIAEQAEAVQAAQAHAEQLMRAALGKHGVTVTFARLSTGAVQAMVGFLQDGSPLRSLLDALGPEAGQAVRLALITGIATGQHPRAIARWIRNALGGNMVRALRIARTEVLRSYRTASLRTYQANADIVKGWYWHAALNTRTCLFCIFMHGSFHSLNERLESHPNCRCAVVPATDFFGPVTFESGKEWFDRQPYDVKTKIMHPAAYEAYRHGGWPLKDFIRIKRDPRWGVTGGPASLSQALGPTKAKYLAAWREVALRRFEDPAWFQARDDLDRMKAALTKIFGLQSNWSGDLHVQPEGSVDWIGAYAWGAGIGVRRDTLSSLPAAARFHVLAHEIIHSFSAGMTPRVYMKLRGWEEGVVEQSARLVLDDLAKALGVKLDKTNEYYVNWVKNDGYNRYIEVLEDMRRRLKMDERSFYFGLLSTNLGNRYEWVLGKAEASDISLFDELALFLER